VSDCAGEGKNKTPRELQVSAVVPITHEEDPVQDTWSHLFPGYSGKTLQGEPRYLHFRTASPAGPVGDPGRMTPWCPYLKRERGQLHQCPRPRKSTAV